VSNLVPRGLQLRASRAKQITPPTRCEAIIEDYVHGTRNNLRSVIVVPKSRQCLHNARVKLGTLCLCTRHGQLAKDGLVDDRGYVAPRGDIRNVRDNPKHFSNGLHSWARNLTIKEI